MSGQNTPSAAPQERADRTADNNVEAAVEGTFPASDPMATIASQGARAVPPEEMMRSGASAPQGGSASLTARFESREAAKLAVESLVRDGPVDPNCADIEAGNDAAATVRLKVPDADRQRLDAMLRKQNGLIG